jgi:hypothetical protein
MARRISTVGERLFHHGVSVSSEPLFPEPISLFGRREATHPSFDEFHERYLRNFNGRDVPKAEHAEGLTVDLVVPPRAALTGCSAPVGIPVFEACSDCGGTGHVWLFPCVDCHGTGWMESERELRVPVPPLTAAGTVMETPLDMFGIQNLYLRVHVSISDEAL